MEIIKNILLYSPDNPMLFTQYFFWIFFTGILGLFTISYKNITLRNFILFIASLYFYYKSGGYFFYLLLLSTLIDYSLGLAIFKTQHNKKRKFFLTLSLLSNLGILFYFKYAYFITSTCNDIFGTNYITIDYIALWTNTITNSNFDIFTIILPVGISFYTFQTISYTVDIYRQKIEPLTNIIDFGLYVTFFPQLVAGPIVRASQFVPQLKNKFYITKEQFGHALFLIINGLIKKILISDYLSLNFVDRVFDAPDNYSGLENLFAVYGYAVQIYCDFSGYTDIAIGTALLLGFKLPLNFNSPYKATNITDFWRRWHISLSTWLRDYLYIPLGGNRHGIFRTYLNLFITMLLGGLWHGANYRFIIWGGLHGIALAIHKIWQTFNPYKNAQKTIFSNFFYTFITFHFVSFLWIFFRATTNENAFIMITKIFTQLNLQYLFSFITSYFFVFSAILITLIIHWLPAQIKEYIRGIFINTPVIIKFIIILLIVILLYQAKSSELQPFIYFQF